VKMEIRHLLPEYQLGVGGSGVERLIVI